MTLVHSQVMHADTEALCASLCGDEVPLAWSRLAYPAPASLAAWVDDLCARLKFFDRWSASRAPPEQLPLWVFSQPTSFLSSMLQAHARQAHVPVDQLRLDCTVMTDEALVETPAPATGVYVRDLFLQGASWDPTAHSLVDAPADELQVRGCPSACPFRFPQRRENFEPTVGWG